MCADGAREVHDEVLKKIDSKNLEVFVVWEYINPTDTSEAALKQSKGMKDPRMTHFWIGNRDMAKLFQKPMGMTKRLAWDLYMVYPPKAEWENSPPTPSYYMHQLGKTVLNDDRWLDTKTLKKEVQKVLDRTAK